jgi:small subunit ribosomal protein S9
VAALCLPSYFDCPTCAPFVGSRLDALQKEDARDAGMLIEAEEEDLSPLSKGPKMPVDRKVDVAGRSWGTGRRKTSTSRVVLQPGTGLVWINNRPVFEYFPRMQHRSVVLSSFQATRTAGLYDAYVVCEGGGVTGTHDTFSWSRVCSILSAISVSLAFALALTFHWLPLSLRTVNPSRGAGCLHTSTGQAEATRLGIARALQNHDPMLRSVLRDGVYLTRDRRAVERKKPGQHKARKKFRHPSR